MFDATILAGAVLFVTGVGALSEQADSTIRIALAIKVMGFILRILFLANYKA